MMKLAIASDISVAELGCLLQNGDLKILLIDCRSFMEFNESHIHRAHNVLFPTIMKRRSGGVLSLANIVRCSRSREQLLAGDYDRVIVYDNSTTALTPNGLPAHSTLNLVLCSINTETTVENLYFLQGGFRAFYNTLPHLCSDALLLTAPEGGMKNLQVTPIAQGISPSKKRFLGHNTCPYTRREHSRQERFVFDQGDPVQILPWLYLGNVFHASQRARLKALGITALLNVSCIEVSQVADFDHKMIPVADSSTADISTWFPEAISFIEKIKKSEGRVLVHCHAGVSRSATICIAYLMYSKHFTLDDAFDFLKSRRSIISPNLNFMQQLLAYQVQLEGGQDCEGGLKSPPAGSPNLSLNMNSKSPKTALGLSLTPVNCHHEGVFVFDSLFDTDLTHSPHTPAGLPLPACSPIKASPLLTPPKLSPPLSPPIAALFPSS